MRQPLPSALVIAAIFWACPSSHADAIDTTRPSEMAIEIEALRTLNDLQVTPAQIQMLRDATAETEGEANRDDVAAIDASPASRAALLALRDDLISGDPSRIEAGQKVLDDLQRKFQISFAPRIEPSDKAIDFTDKLMRKFSGRQFSGLVAQRSEEIPDPADLLLAAFVQCRGMPPDDFKRFSQDVSQQIGILVGGLGRGARQRLANEAVSLMQFAHDVSDSEFNSKHQELDENGKDVTKSSSVAVIRHWVEWEFAQLLSNPELDRALSDYPSRPEGNISTSQVGQ